MKMLEKLILIIFSHYFEELIRSFFISLLFENKSVGQQKQNRKCFIASASKKYISMLCLPQHQF
jgi:hypothetical protein